MKKYRIEIGLSIILFISVVVLIVNIIIKANNGGKDVTGEEKQMESSRNTMNGQRQKRKPNWMQKKKIKSTGFRKSHADQIP